MMPTVSGYTKTGMFTIRGSRVVREVQDKGGQSRSIEAEWSRSSGWKKNTRNITDQQSLLPPSSYATFGNLSRTIKLNIPRNMFW